MDFEEEDALYRDLARFTGEEEAHRHVSGMLICTEGVRLLAERARLSWFVDLIADLQPRALADPALRNFQVWELRLRGRGAVVVCSRDSEDAAFSQEIPHAGAALGCVQLYLMAGVLHLPTETFCRRLRQRRTQEFT